jgi:hypothetical protein
MKILGEETIDGRECLVVELPYLGGKAWILKRIKGKDAKKLQGITAQEDIINLVVKKVEPSIEGSLYDELDLVEINFIGDYYDSISKSDLTDVKKK